MPYWRLSAYYFFYFAALGALVPYWGPYLRERGFDAVAIGELMAILSGTKIIAPILWGWVADHGGGRMRIVRFAALVSVLVFGAIFFVDGYWGIAAVMLLFSFFWNASLPQMEAVTFNHLGARANRYALIRVWGSVGFIITVMLLGWAIGQYGSGVLLGAVLSLYVGIWLSTLQIPDRAHAQAADRSVSLRGCLRRSEVIAFLVACFLMQAGHGVYYAFYSIHLAEHGYQGLAIGSLWAWGVVVEVGVFAIMHRLLDRFGARRMLLFSLATAALRWVVIGLLVDQVWIQLLAQAAHAATFGSFHAAAIHLAHHYFPGRAQGRGQALYNSLSFGAGVASGSLIAGYLWGHIGGGATFAAASLTAVLGWVAVWRFVDPERRY